MSKLSPRDEAIIGAALARIQASDTAVSVTDLISCTASVAVLMDSFDPDDDMTGEVIDSIVRHLKDSLVSVLGGPASRVALKIAQNRTGWSGPCF